MEKILEGIPYTATFIDDIVCGGKSEEHYNFCLIFPQISAVQYKIKESKCFFLQREITYIGHCIDEQGVHPTNEDVQAIRHMKMPENKKELRSFYAWFIPNLQALCAPFIS